MFDLSGKKALVTGATGGLGSCIAEKLHAQGAHVILTGSREKVLEEKTRALGEGCEYIVCNLQDQDSIERLIDQVALEHGGVDILVNNAGITRDNLSMRMKDEEFDDVIAVNLRAPFLLIRGFLKHMMKARWGRIINISSVVGQGGNPGQANYCASKSGIIGMGKAVAMEVASRGITVNAIAPGFIKSAMTDELGDKVREKILGSIPMASMGVAEDIASAAVYLASPEAGYVTGQTIHVNGGMLMA